MSRRAVVIVSVLALLGAPAASGLGLAPVATVDRFEDLSAWTFEGGEFTHECGDDGCSLRVAPTCCSEYALATRSVDILVVAPTTLSMRFQGDVLWGDVDTELSVRYSGGSEVLFRVTDGWGEENNGFSVDTSLQQSDRFGTWNATDAWYEIRLAFDPQSGTITPSVIGAQGDVLASTSALLAGDITSIDTVRIQSAAWGSGGTYAWDTLVIAPDAVAQEMRDLADDEAGR